MFIVVFKVINLFEVFVVLASGGFDVGDEAFVLEVEFPIVLVVVAFASECGAFLQLVDVWQQFLRRRRKVPHAAVSGGRAGSWPDHFASRQVYLLCCELYLW